MEGKERQREGGEKGHRRDGGKEEALVSRYKRRLMYTLVKIKYCHMFVGGKS